MRDKPNGGVAPMFQEDNSSIEQQTFGARPARFDNASSPFCRIRPKTDLRTQAMSRLR
jgi:hypothetical protein